MKFLELLSAVRRRTALLALVLIPAASAFASSVAPGYYTSYNVTLQAGMPSVTNILMIEHGDGWGSGTWAFTADGGATTGLANPFAHSSPVLESLLIGITQDLPSDTIEGQKHVVLMMDPSAAGRVSGIAWGTVFPHTFEDSLIAAIELATSGQDWSIIQPGLDDLDAFLSGDASHGNLGSGGTEGSAFFSMGSAFSVMTWSDGAQIGSGTSQQTVVTPEPGAFGLLAAGLGLIAVVRRRRTA